MRAFIARRSLEVTLALVFAAEGCSEDAVQDVYHNEGTLCLAHTQSGALQADVFIDRCYSSSCSDVVERSCAVGRDGNTLAITSRVKVELPHADAPCTADCVTYGASCELEGIPAGEYRLVHGDFETTVTLPLVDGKWSQEDAGNFTCPLELSE